MSYSEPGVSEGSYGVIMAVGIVMVMLGLAGIIVGVWMNFGLRTCDPAIAQARWTASELAPGPVCVIARMIPSYLAGAFVAVVGLIVAFRAANRRKYWYAEVLEGTVVDFHEVTSGYGVRTYFVVVRGRTRAGQLRDWEYEVSERSYNRMEKGDKFSPCQ